MKLREAYVQKHCLPEAKDVREECECQDIRHQNEEEEAWTVGMGRLLTLMILVAFSEQRHGHEGKDEREVEDVSSEEEGEEEEDEAWIVGMDKFSQDWNQGKN